MKRRLEALPTDEAERRRLLLAMLAEDSDEADESEESEGGEEGEEGEDASDEDGSDDGESDENEALPDLDAEGRIAGYAGIDHSVRSFANALPLDEEQRSALTRDCRLVFALNSSNWLAASAEPRCSLEAVARAIFERHTGGATYDAARSGCEWWAQAQPLPPPPSPPAATTFTYRRSSLTFLSHHHQVRTSGEAAEAIEFHWDCDEYCCDVHDVHVSPVLSSVTYLGDYGAPTLVLAVPSPHSASQDLAAAHGPIEGGTLSYPRVCHRGLEPQASGAQASRLLTRVSLASPRLTSPHLASPRLTSPRLGQAGKHLVFDGRLLHGAVPTDTEHAHDVRPGSVRLSFLVNVWLHHKPRGVKPLPATLLPQLSKALLTGSGAGAGGRRAVPRALRALRTPAPPDRPTHAWLGQSAAGGGGGGGGGAPRAFAGGRVLEVSFGRNSNAHALRVPLPRRGGGDGDDGGDGGDDGGDGGDDGGDGGDAAPFAGKPPGAPARAVRAGAAHSVDDTVTLHFGLPASPWRPAAEVYENASPLAAAPLRKKKTKASGDRTTVE